MREALAGSSQAGLLLPSSKVAVCRERGKETSSPETRPARERLQEALRAAAALLKPLHALHLYGAAGIAAFGWAMARQTGFSPGPLLPLWAAGALLVYNLDRLKRDPADSVNTPGRVRCHASLRAWSAGLAAAGAAVLAGWPVALGSPGRLALVLLGAPLALAYSFPILGRRLKDVPALKTIFAPAMVLAAVLCPPMLFQGLRPGPALLRAAAWGGALLMFNMLLCDLRDIEGDRAAGTRSLPVLLGSAGARGLLWMLAALAAAFAPGHGWNALLTAAALAPLALVARRRRAEAFYEWLGEGILFLPAILELAHRLAA